MAAKDAEFPYVVVSHKGPRVAAFSDALAAVLYIEQFLETGALIQIDDKIVWYYSKKIWDEALAGDDDGFTLLASTVEHLREQLAEIIATK